MFFCQDFFKKLEDDTGYDAVNLNNIHSLYDILFVEVNIRTCIYYIYRQTLPIYVDRTCT